MHHVFLLCALSSRFARQAHRRHAFCWFRRWCCIMRLCSRLRFRGLLCIMPLLVCFCVVVVRFLAHDVVWQVFFWIRK